MEKGKKLLTIFTPAYNRGDTLPTLFESLLRQSSFDFKWLIIDDGSTDNTKEVVSGFNTDKFEIEYHLKENGGKHTAINKALEIIDTELTFIVDSDDYLTDDAVETIGQYYDKWKDKDIASMVFLMGYPSGECNGGEFLSSDKLSWYVKDVINNRLLGDRAMVFVTEKLKEFPFPVYEGERFMSEAVQWMPLYRKYPFVPVNKIIYIAEYLDGGLTKQGKKMRLKNPLGGILNNEMFIKKDVEFGHRIKSAILIVVFAKAAGIKIPKHIWKEYKLLMMLAYIPGQIFYKKWNR